jgi:hypothetical protein
LVKVGEDALAVEEELMGSVVGNRKIQLCRAAEEKKRYWPYSYGQVISLILKVTTIMFVVIAILVAR